MPLVNSDSEYHYEATIDIHGRGATYCLLRQRGTVVLLFAPAEERDAMPHPLLRYCLLVVLSPCTLKDYNHVSCSSSLPRLS